MDDGYSCACQILRNMDHFLTIDAYKIKLCHESGCQILEESFEPSQNIQLTPPHDVEVELTPETVNITWKSGYEKHKVLEDTLDFELLLQTSQSTEDRSLRLSRQTSTFIQRSHLNQDATYCIKVRSILNQKDYKRNLSEWSPSACIKIKAAEEQDNILVILMKSLGPACVAVGVLLFVFSSPAARMKIKTLSHTPSPAPFFKPLYQQHEGNLQEWLSPKGKFLLTYNPEEIVTTDAVVVVPKPVPKDPEENQVLQKPSVTQLLLSQCPTSYVGLPGIHEASPPLTMVCPGDMPYTQLPCSVWGVSVGEAEVVSTPVKDFLNISRADSGCSCEDLPLPDCSLPNSPVDDSPPPCFCNDYCILNKTADGFAPVLVSKGSSLNVQSDSLQEDDS
uniref:uncharacterized protein n=1 Tax=Semicossyphus pulcher TaxID=241346 RepID=UPI0037E86F12